MENEKNYDASRYRTPDGITGDIVIFTLLPKRGHDASHCSDLKLHVLLIQRKNWPFAGMWALPGGFCDPDESIDECARRELYEETGIEDVGVTYCNVYSNPGRDPRGWMISHSFYALVKEDKLHARQAADDAADVRLFAIDDVLNMDLAFDHHDIVVDALNRVKRDMLETSIAKDFLQPSFTLAQLSAVIRAVVPDFELVDQLVDKLEERDGECVSELDVGHKQKFEHIIAKERRGLLDVLEEVSGEVGEEVSDHSSEGNAGEARYRFASTVPRLSIYR